MLNLFLSNWKLKLLAFFIAVFIWFHAVTEKKIVYFMKVPVVVTDLPKDMTVDSINADSILVRIEGRRKDIMLLNWFAKREIYLKIRSFDEKHFSIRPTPSDVHIPMWFDLKVREDMYPPKIDVVLDKKFEKEFEVQPIVQGRPAEGYVKKPPYITEPPTILVVGGKRTVSKLQQILTNPINIENAKDTVCQYVHLINSTHKRLRYIPDSVFVKVPVERIEQRTISLKVKNLNIKKAYKNKIREDSIVMVLSGPESVVTTLSYKDILSYLDITKIGDSLSINVIMPAYMMLINLEPKYLHINR